MTEAECKLEECLAAYRNANDELGLARRERDEVKQRFASLVAQRDAAVGQLRLIADECSDAQIRERIERALELLEAMR